ncbi:MAG: hypothetical protein WC264_03955 [Candidatus Paceibacterota bacterium]|jgi:hypothetical protein
MKRKNNKKIFISIFFAIVFAVFFILPTNHAQAAANIFDGSTDSNWGTAGNWSLGAVPTASDGNIATFDASSPDCTVNASSRVANAIDFTNYTNTITMSYAITVSGNITLGASMNVSGTVAMIASATANLTSNGKTWPAGFIFTGTSQTFTLIDDWNVDGLLTLAGTTAQTINGFTIYAGGGLTSGTVAVTGTTNLVLNGTGTWTGGGYINLNLTINTAGTITLAGGGNFCRKGTGTLTYTAGTIIDTGITLAFSSGATLTLAGYTWNNISLGGAPTTYTLTNAITTTTLTLSGSGNPVINGQSIHATDLIVSSTGINGGTTTIDVSGTWSNSSTGYVTNDLTLNTGSTISGNVYYRLGTLTVSAGASITVTSSTLTLGAGAIGAILNLNGLTLNNLAINSTSGSISLTSGLIISGAFTNTDSASHPKILSSVGGTQRVVTLLAGATQNLSKVDATDIDSSAGQTIRTYNGVLSNTTNWISTLGGLLTVAYTFVF